MCIFLRRAQYDLLSKILLIRLVRRTSNQEQLFPRDAKLAISSWLLALCRYLCEEFVYKTGLD